MLAIRNSVSGQMGFPSCNDVLPLVMLSAGFSAERLLTSKLTPVKPSTLCRSAK
jgi:hypothetical protein